MELNAFLRITDSPASAQLVMTAMLTLNAQESQDVNQIVSVQVLKPVLIPNVLHHANVESMQNALSRIIKPHVNAPPAILEIHLKYVAHPLTLVTPIPAEHTPFANLTEATRSATVLKE